jgi:hypothetical protein
MQLTLEIESPNELQLLLQYIRLLSSVTVLAEPRSVSKPAAAVDAASIFDPSGGSQRQGLTVEQFMEAYTQESSEIRAFSAQSTAFGFWENEAEDIYQDYLPTATVTK